MRPVELVPHNPVWPAEFARFGRRLHTGLGRRALALHHIGSTAVPGLPARDVIDIQLTVAAFESVPDGLLADLGFDLHSVEPDHCPAGMVLAAPELEKRLFTARERPAELHVRVAGRFNQRFPLICRDYLRAHRHAAAAYREAKLRLADRFGDDPDSYAALKAPIFDLLYAAAETVLRGWRPAPNDA